MTALRTRRLPFAVASPSRRGSAPSGLPPSPAQGAPPREQAEWKRERAKRRKEAFAALTRRERAFLYCYYAISLPAMPVGLLLTIYGTGTTRTVGIALLLGASSVD